MQVSFPPRAVLGSRLVLLAAILVLSARAGASASPASQYIGTASADQLSKVVGAGTAGAAGIKVASSGKGAAPSLMPTHPAASLIGPSIQAEQANIVVEALFLWHRPWPVDPGAEILAVYNTLRAVSSLKGIDYYSASRKKRWPLYEYSSLVAGRTDNTPVGDTRLAALPAAPETLFARQKDTTFGDNSYQITLAGGAGFVRQSSTNLTRLSLGIVPVAAPGDVNLRVLVLSTDEGLVFYAVSSARATLLPGIQGTLEASFGNRAEALYAWFSDRLAAAWPPGR